jgi:hypothetical protein
MANSIRHVVEQTLAIYLSTQSGLAGVQILTGDSAVTQTLPKAVVLCDSARAPGDLPEGLCNYECSVRVTLFSNADDTTLATHRERCAALSDCMKSLDLIQDAFAAGGAALCYDVTYRSEDEGIDERSWATSFAFDILTVLDPAA